MTTNQFPSLLGSKADFKRLYRLQVTELADYALFLIDPEGIVASWNVGVQAILQYTRGEFVGRPFADLFTPEDRRAGVHEQEMRTAAVRGRSADVRWHLRKDGSRVFIDGVLNAICEEDNQLVGFTKVMRDATARHDAEIALRDSEAFARSIVESSPDCVKVLDLEGRLQVMNQTGCRVMDIGDFKDWQDRAWVELWQGEDRAAARKAIEEARKGRQTIFEAASLSRKGNRMWWDVVVTPILDGQGRPARILSIARNITERKRAEEMMRRTHDDLAEFAHVVSHDLQAPLRSVRSYTQLLAKRYQGQLDETADTFISFILEGAKNMDELIRGLLHYAEFGGEEGEHQPVALSHIVDTVLIALKALIEETGARITCGDLPTVQGNPIQIQQVFQNLIGNALKYRSEAEPRIHIDCARKDGYWEVAISDNGVGIAPEHYDQVFLPLKRLHGSEIAGTGLGLALCKRIVERSGGRIWVRSAPGQGSTFRFTIPVKES